jgi:SAM-dependent methyltransferase
MSYHEVFLLKNCPLCASSNTKPVKFERNQLDEGFNEEVRTYSDTWVTLLQCQECSFAFSKEIPSDPKFFEKRYQFDFDPNFEYHAGYKSSILIQTFNLIKKYKKGHGKLLDLGSFGGNLMKFAAEEGYEAEGVEVNKNMAEHCSKSLNMVVHNLMVQDFEGHDGEYDVITLIDVLEHLFEPKGVIQAAERLLRPGGVLVIKVPHYGPQHFKQNIANFLGLSKRGIFHNFGHINLFTPKSLSKALSSSGLEPLECIVAESELWGSDSLKFKVKNISRIVVHTVLEYIRKLTGINLGLNITIIAKKN